MKLAAFLLIACATACAAAEIFTSSAHRFRIETVADGLEHPWAVAKLPDGDFLVTERAGRVLRIGKDGTKTSVEGVPEVVVKGQGGLLDLALHPQYEENGWIYLAYAKPLPGGSMTAVARARLKDDRLQDLEMVFDPPADQASDTGLHFGCRIVFDGRGHVFFSIGDRGGPTNPENLAQSLSSVTGKIQRLHDDGRVPSDNPFGRVTSPGKPPTGNTTLAAIGGAGPAWMMSTADQQQPNVGSAPWRNNTPEAPPLGNKRAIFRFDGAGELVMTEQP